MKRRWQKGSPTWSVMSLMKISRNVGARRTVELEPGVSEGNCNMLGDGSRGTSGYGKGGRGDQDYINRCGRSSSFHSFGFMENAENSIFLMSQLI